MNTGTVQQARIPDGKQFYVIITDEFEYLPLNLGSERSKAAWEEYLAPLVGKRVTFETGMTAKSAVRVRPVEAAQGTQQIYAL